MAEVHFDDGAVAGDRRIQKLVTLVRDGATRIKDGGQREGSGPQEN